MQSEHAEKMFTLIEPEWFARRILRNLREAAGEFAANPRLFLQTAFFDGSAASWLPGRFFTAIGGALTELFTQPLRALRNFFAADALALGYLNPTAAASASFTTNTYSTTKRARRSRLFTPLLAASVFVHFVAIGFLFYLKFIAPYAGLTVVNKPYRPYDDKLIAVAPVGARLKQGALDNAMSLEEIRERERKRREDAERRKREEEERRKREEERRKAEEERLAKEQAEQEAKDKAAAEQTATAAGATTAEKPKFGEINEAPIKDILGKIYSLHQVGFVNVDTHKLSLMLTFKVERDGTISNIVVKRSSGNNLVDRYAKEILWNLGESRALGPLHVLTSNTIALDLTEKTARLSITGFAPTESEANDLARNLNILFGVMRALRKKDSPDVAELLSHMKVTSTAKRVDADLTISNERAGELMKAKFGKTP